MEGGHRQGGKGERGKEEGRGKRSAGKGEGRRDVRGERERRTGSAAWEGVQAKTERSTMTYCRA